MYRYMLSSFGLASLLVWTTNGFLFSGSCLNRCNEFHTNDDFLCQCNKQCVNYGDCCSDYTSTCTGSSSSCQSRCNAAVSHAHTCQCNSHCVRYNDCCSDYNALCGGGDSTHVSGQCKTLSQMGQSLWDNDVNRLTSSDVTINYQSKVTFGSTTDKAPSSLFTTVNASKLHLPTYTTFISLLDNYNPYYSSTEHGSSHETSEIYKFLDAVLETKVMAELLNFLICQSKVTSQSDLKSLLKKIWFDFYTRGSKDAYRSSSGFEHVMVGEYADANTVNGFHSWLSFYEKEKAGDLNYMGYVSRKSNPDILGAAFTWNGHVKSKGTFFVGTSPEFDLAIYTMCYVMTKGTCQFNVNGHVFSIQTHDNKGHVASAYVTA